VAAATLLLVAWGAFAFGAVYPWAYVPLAVGCGCVGLLGLLTGKRPIFHAGRWVLAPLIAIGVVGLIQIVPMPAGLLAAVSPGTRDFLQRFDLGFAYSSDLATNSNLPSHAVSIAPMLTVRALWLFASFLLLFVGLWRTLSRTAVVGLASGIVVIGCLLALVGVSQKALLGDHAFGGMRIYGFWKPESLLTTPFGPFVNKNHFAGWMLMAMPMAFGRAAARLERALPRLNHGGIRALLVWFSEPEGGRTLLHLVAGTFMTSALLMTGSRSGIACGVVVIMALLAASRSQVSRRGMVVAAVVTLIGFAAILQWAGPDAALQRFVRDPESVSLRLSIWRASWDAFKQFPVLGGGLNTFGTLMIVFQRDAARVHYAEAHNDYVQLAVEGGLVVLLLALTTVVAVVRNIRGHFNDAIDGTEARWVRTAASIGLFAIAVQSLVEFSLQMPGNTTLFAVVLALAVFTPAPFHHAEQKTDRGSATN
jgi:hypothetical protein